MYGDAQKRATEKYIKTNVKQVCVPYRKEDWKETETAIKKSGLPVSAFFKQAVREKLERDGLL